MFPFPSTFFASAAGGGTVDPVLVQSAQNSNGNTGLTTDVTWGVATTLGNFLVAVVTASRPNASGTAPVFTPPSGWTLATGADGVSEPTGAKVRTSIYYKANAASESGAKTWSATGMTGANSIGVVMAEYSGITASSPLDQTGTASDTSTSSTTVSSGTVTSPTSQARTLAIAALRGGSTLGSIANSFTIRAQTSQAAFIALADKLITSISSPVTSATYSTGQNNVGCIATFKVAN